MQLRTLPLLALLACKATAPVTFVPVEGDTDTDVDADTDADTDTDTGEPICPDFGVEPTDVTVEIGQTVAFVGTGGTGAYTWTLSGDRLGVLSASGAYEAPPVPGTDHIELADPGCPSVQTTVTVVEPLQAVPSAAVVPPETFLPFTATGGSGDFSCTLVADGSGASLAGCDYTAGASAGADTVRLTDAATGVSVDVQVEVDPGVTLTPLGSERWAFPLDAWFAPRMVGGTGLLDIHSDDPAVTVDPADPGRVFGASGGTATLHITDALVPSLSTIVQATVMLPRVPPANLDGRLLAEGRIRLVDLDADGVDDLVVGHAGASVDGPVGGAAAVFAGLEEGGFAGTPSWQATGRQEGEQLGRGLDVADLDGDGLPDLVVGVPGADWHRENVGEVHIHRGIPGGFESLPDRILRGTEADDHLGRSLVTCDVDADGFVDVVAFGSADDPQGEPDAGSIAVYRGSMVGLLEPPVVRYGMATTGTGFTQIANLRAGVRGVAAGDHDGDGACDVAVGVFDRDPDGGRGSGFVQVFRGRTDGTTLSETPAWTYGEARADTNRSFGHAVAFGDLDGDGLDELAVGARYDDAGGQDRGTVQVFGGRAAPVDAHVPIVAPDFALDGTDDFGFVGDAVDIVDDRLFVGASRLQGTGGVLRITPVLDGRTATPEDATLLAGGESGASFGLRVRGRADGSVVVLEGRHTEAGRTDVERFVWTDGTTSTNSSVEQKPAAQETGLALALLDVTGEGTHDLVVGAFEAAEPSRGALSGRVWLDADGWTEHPAVLPSIGTGDRRGRALATGDIDGDGHDDLLELARFESRPALPEDLQSTCGTGAVTQGGAVTITRGSAEGLADEPAYVLWGAVSGSHARTLISGFDHDGDGYDDLLVGFDGGTERVALVHGRAAEAGVQELCASLGIRDVAGSRFGEASAALGDLDGDGCDEVAVGARLADPALTNEGQVAVLWGAGPACGQLDPTVTVLRSGRASSQAGAALAGGEDIDADGVPDLVVGAPGLTSGGWVVGGVWTVSGAWLAEQPRASLVNGRLPSTTQGSLAGLPLLSGMLEGQRLGSSVALVPADPPLLAAGMDGIVGGGVTLHRFDQGGPRTEPSIWVAGESQRDDGELGTTLLASEDALFIGAPGSSAGGGLHNGAVYTLPL